MLQAVVIGRSGKDTREALPNRVSVKDLSYDSQIKDYTMDYDAKEVQCTDNTFAVTKAGATVTFNFTGSGAGETYFNINGLDYEGAAQFQLYFGKRKFDPLDLYSKADWKELSHNEKKKIFKNFSLKLLSAVFAVVLWTVIVNIYDPNTSYTFSNITVQLINTQSLTDKDYSYEVVDGGKISVTVSGPKSVVTDLKTSDISATADLSKVTAFTDYVDIQVQVIKDGQVLNNVEAVPRTSALKLSIENRDTKTLSLDVNTTGSTASGYTVASTSSSPTYIKVTGPTSLLESVAALSVNVDVSGAKEDISTSADVKMLDEDGNEIVNDALELSCTKADINVDIARMKTVSITAKTGGTPSDGYIITDTILSQASAVITGSDDLLGKVDPSQNINADGLSADKTYTFRLSDYVPSGIKFVSDSSLTVTVKIAQKATKQISLSASEITLNNIQQN